MAYSPVHPIGLRLGITTFWHPATLNGFLSDNFTKQVIIITQWLIKWFYVQQIYFSKVELVDFTRHDVFLSLAYLSVPSVQWRRRRRFKPKRSRYRARIKPRQRWLYFGQSGHYFFRYSRPALVATHGFQTRYNLLTGCVFTHLGTAVIKNKNRMFSQFGLYSRYFSFLGGVMRRLKRRVIRILKKFGEPFVYLNDFRYRNLFTVGGYKQLATMESYTQDLRELHKQRPICLKKLTHITAIFRWKYSRLFVWSRRVLRKRQKFMRRLLPQRFKRLLFLACVKIRDLRVLWYLKRVFDLFFKRNAFLVITNYYSYYFYVSVPTRLQLVTRRQFKQYSRSLNKKGIERNRQFRQYLSQLKTKYQPIVPYQKRKYAFMQIVLYLGLPPLWRKMANTNVLCYLIILSVMLRETQMLAQWLYNVIFNARTRRLKSFRMRFFILVSKILRDYIALGHGRLQGFRFEIFGKTGRSQKTSMRFFGSLNGLQISKFRFRFIYQMFSIPTYAGVLGIRFWLY